jgi:3',5'-cyclic AMP phosphodiesterase CpdA
MAKSNFVSYTAAMASVKKDQPKLNNSRNRRAEASTADRAFVIAHLSDFHLGLPDPVGVRALLNKRVLGYIMWRLRRRAEHRPEVLTALVSDVRDSRPDHIVVTGDLTHLGLAAEFLRVRRWLSALGPPTEVTVIPGNHDAYVRDAWGGPVAQWADYMVSDGLSSPDPMVPLGLFPTVRIRGPFAVIGVCTARPSLPFLAVGTIGRAQLARVEKVLETTGRRDLYRIVLIHHPPVPGAVTWHRRLTDSAAFRTVLARQGAELVLHGHAHRTSMHQLSTPGGGVPVIGVPSASTLGRTVERGSRYHLYHVRRDERGWNLRIAVRAYPFKEKAYPGGEALLNTSSS